jgi:hypothetical protein
VVPGDGEGGGVPGAPGCVPAGRGAEPVIPSEWEAGSAPQPHARITVATGQEPVIPSESEAGSAPQPHQTFCGRDDCLAPGGIQTPNCPAHNLVNGLTAVCQLL